MFSRINNPDQPSIDTGSLTAIGCRSPTKIKTSTTNIPANRSVLKNCRTFILPFNLSAVSSATLPAWLFFGSAVARRASLYASRRRAESRIFFAIGFLSTFKHIPIGVASILGVGVCAICMNGMDKPFHDLPDRRSVRTLAEV